jgi:GxxExxY protein
MHENQIAAVIVDLAYRLHCQYGPGVYENVYETIMAYEMKKKGWAVQCQLPLPIQHEGLFIPDAYKLDILVEDKVIIELKSIEKLEKKHFKQLTTYLRLAGKRLGLLINFGEEKIVIKRIVNGLTDDGPED